MTRHLTAGEKDFYDSKGYLHVEGLLTAAEAALYRAEVHALAALQGETDATWESQRGAGTTIEH